MDHNKLWKILKETGIPDHHTCFAKNLCAGQEETELYMKQQIGSNLGKEYIKAIYCHPAYLTYILSTPWKVPDWMTPSWNQDFRNTNNLRFPDDTTLMAENEEELKILLMKVKRLA